MKVTVTVEDQDSSDDGASGDEQRGLRKCASCSQPASDARLARCLHVFCLACVENHVRGVDGAVQCPRCSALTTSPGKRPGCSVVDYLPRLPAAATAAAAVAAAVSCALCDVDGVRAVYRCAQCSELPLCQPHSERHRKNKSEHLLQAVAANELTGGSHDNDGELLPLPRLCSLHRTHPLTDYCLTCDLALCSLCRATSRHDADEHSIMAVAAAAGARRRGLLSSVFVRAVADDDDDSDDGVGAPLALPAEAELLRLLAENDERVRLVHENVMDTRRQAAEFYGRLRRAVAERERRATRCLDDFQRVELDDLDRQRARVHERFVEARRKAAAAAEMLQPPNGTSSLGDADFVMASPWLKMAAVECDESLRALGEPGAAAAVRFRDDPRVATAIGDAGMLDIVASVEGRAVSPRATGDEDDPIRAGYEVVDGSVHVLVEQRRNPDLRRRVAMDGTFPGMDASQLRLEVRELNGARHVLRPTNIAAAAPTAASPGRPPGEMSSVGDTVSPAPPHIFMFSPPAAGVANQELGDINVPHANILLPQSGDSPSSSSSALGHALKSYRSQRVVSAAKISTAASKTPESSANPGAANQVRSSDNGGAKDHADVKTTSLSRTAATAPSGMVTPATNAARTAAYLKYQNTCPTSLAVMPIVVGGGGGGGVCGAEDPDRTERREDLLSELAFSFVPRRIGVFDLCVRYADADVPVASRLLAFRTPAFRFEEPSDRSPYRISNDGHTVTAASDCTEEITIYAAEGQLTMFDPSSWALRMHWNAAVPGAADAAIQVGVVERRFSPTGFVQFQSPPTQPIFAHSSPSMANAAPPAAKAYTTPAPFAAVPTSTASTPLSTGLETTPAGCRAATSPTSKLLHLSGAPCPTSPKGEPALREFLFSIPQPVSIDAVAGPKLDIDNYSTPVRESLSGLLVFTFDPSAKVVRFFDEKTGGESELSWDGSLLPVRVAVRIPSGVAVTVVG